MFSLFCRCTCFADVRVLPMYVLPMYVFCRCTCFADVRVVTAVTGKLIQMHLQMVAMYLPLHLNEIHFTVSIQCAYFATISISQNTVEGHRFITATHVNHSRSTPQRENGCVNQTLQIHRDVGINLLRNTSDCSN